MAVLQSCSFSVSMEAEDVEVIDDNQNTDVCPSDRKDDSGSLPLPSMFNILIEEENDLMIIIICVTLHSYSLFEVILNCK